MRPDLRHVEAHLHAPVRDGSLLKGNDRAVPSSQARERLTDGEVHGLRVSVDVAYVMRKGADGECKLIGAGCVAQQRIDKVARADVVRKVAEEIVRERIISKV